MRKKKVVAAGLLILAIGIAIVVYLNFLRPVKISSVNVSCINLFSSSGEMENYERNLNDGNYNKNTTIIHNYNGALESDDLNDYMMVYINLDFVNRSFLQAYNMDGLITNFKVDSDRPICSYTLTNVLGVNVFRMSEKQGCVIVDICIADKSDEEIKEMIRGIELEFVAKGQYFGEQKIKIGLSDVDDIVIKRK